MIIAAKYENGVFKPLEDVKLTEGHRRHGLPERLNVGVEEPKTFRDCPGLLRLCTIASPRLAD
jgi:hypothetical protein